MGRTAQMWVFGAVLLMGCPAEESALRINSVEVEGSLESVDFVLVVRGHGFGLSQVSIELGGSRGDTTAVTYIVQIVSNQGDLVGSATDDQLVVLDPNTLRARFMLAEALGAGVYNVQLVDQSNPGVILTSLERAIIIDDGTPRDAGITDTPVVGGDDAGVVLPDAGVDPWIGDFTFRQTVTVTNETASPSTPGTTVLIPVSHAQLIGDGRARADGRDLAIYLDAQRLSHQWDNPAQLGQDELALIAALPDAVGAGASVSLRLYAGDPALATATATDAVFGLVERFDDATLPGWFTTAWQYASDSGNQAEGSARATDGNGNPTRKTIATPVDSLPLTSLGDTGVFEVSVWIFGRMIDTTDVLYFSYGDKIDEFHTTTEIDSTGYSLFTPNASVTFQDSGPGANRTVSGWRLGPIADVWRRSRIRFRPIHALPSLHFRYISIDTTNSANTRVDIDDIQVRPALEPDFDVSAGPAETR